MLKRALIWVFLIMFGAFGYGLCYLQGRPVRRELVMVKRELVIAKNALIKCGQSMTIFQAERADEQQQIWMERYAGEILDNCYKGVRGAPYYHDVLGIITACYSLNYDGLIFTAEDLISQAMTETDFHPKLVGKAGERSAFHIKNWKLTDNYESAKEARRILIEKAGGYKSLRLAVTRWNGRGKGAEDHWRRFSENKKALEKVRKLVEKGGE